MLFNSFEFLVFFPIVCTIFFSLKSQTSRLALLFLSSCIFYAFFIPAYLLILFLVIAIDFYAGQKIGEAKSKVKRKLYLALSLSANLSILAFFKYANFFILNVNELAKLLHWNYSLSALSIILPIGLSFHTFQSMAYVLEVYYGRYPAEKNWLRYSVYVLYFPQLVAGPIERPQNILPQLKQFHTFDDRRTVSALFLIIQGFFKKVVVADALAPLVNQVFAEPRHFGSLATGLAIVSFSVQIYCDFSGYSDIARGLSRIFGIELMQNFAKPYFSNSIGEFWRNWHRSLSTWFRDYVFIPAGGSRGSKQKTSFNLLLVFALSGLWHGANWTFVIWGLLHGFYLIFENLVLKPLGQSKWPAWLNHGYVFSFVAFTWIFFRASSLENANAIIHGLAHAVWLGWSELPVFRWQEALILIFSIFFFESLDRRFHFWNSISALPRFQRWSFYVATVLLFLFTAQFTGTQFIYFQF